MAGRSRHVHPTSSAPYNGGSYTNADECMNFPAQIMRPAANRAEHVRGRSASGVHTPVPRSRHHPSVGGQAPL